MGVIGAVRIIQQLARCRSGQNVSLATQTGSLAPEKLRQVWPCDVVGCDVGGL